MNLRSYSVRTVFFTNIYLVKKQLFYKIYICKKAAFLQYRFFTPHIYKYIFRSNSRGLAPLGLARPDKFINLATLGPSALASRGINIFFARIAPLGPARPDKFINVATLGPSAGINTIYGSFTPLCFLVPFNSFRKRRKLEQRIG